MQSDRSIDGSRLNRRKYLSHVLVILSGNGAAQVANLLGYPFLARLYSPHEFGAFGMFVAASAIPGAVACGRFEFAVTTSPRWGATAALWLCITISALIGLLSAAGAAIYWWASAPGVPYALTALFGLCVFLTGFCTANSYYLMRRERFRAVSASLLIRTGSAVAAQVALAFVAANAVSLMLGFTFGLLAQAVMLAALTWRKEHPGPPRVRKMLSIFGRYRRQVFVDFPSTLISAVAGNMLTFALAILYDQRTVGFYSIGSRLAVVPLTLFNDSLAQVFFQKAARAREEKGHMWDELKFSGTISFLLSLGLLAAIFFLARPVVGVFLGVRWMPAADMLVILSPMLAARSFAMSLATTVYLLRSAHWLFAHNVATVILPLAAFVAARLLHLSPTGFLTIVSVLLTVEYLLFGFFLTYAARRDRIHGAVAKGVRG